MTGRRGLMGHLAGRSAGQLDGEPVRRLDGGPTERATGRTAGRRAGRGWRRTAGAVALLTLAATGCGIRGTSVPVDAGGAPARVSCKAPAGTAAPGEGTQATLYLVCGSALAQVERTVPPAKGAAGTDVRLRTARALLRSLQQPPSPEEEKAGFSSALPADLKVEGPHPGDPADALRLSLPPDDLPSFALAQLVCTYGASPALGRTHAAVLSGPDHTTPHRYDCSADVLSNPDIAEHAGWGDTLTGRG
ncbi:lipoprotein [Streptomyces nigrescens]|uniref:Lipoprotein n=1 Tax=Streptomyces nigrescens TaxID=1920 RepID=A0ABM8A1Z6_STRNI|nr:lipoprotein [Streptomyces nigrescens]